MSLFPPSNGQFGCRRLLVHRTKCYRDYTCFWGRFTKELFKKKSRNGGDLRKSSSPSSSEYRKGQNRQLPPVAAGCRQSPPVAARPLSHSKKKSHGVGWRLVATDRDSCGAVFLFPNADNSTFYVFSSYKRRLGSQQSVGSLFFYYASSDMRFLAIAHSCHFLSDFNSYVAPQSITSLSMNANSVSCFKATDSDEVDASQIFNFGRRTIRHSFGKFSPSAIGAAD